MGWMNILVINVENLIYGKNMNNETIETILAIILIFYSYFLLKEKIINSNTHWISLILLLIFHSIWMIWIVKFSNLSWVCPEVYKKTKVFGEYKKWIIYTVRDVLMKK